MGMVAAYSWSIHDSLPSTVITFRNFYSTPCGARCRFKMVNSLLLVLSTDCLRLKTIQFFLYKMHFQPFLTITLYQGETNISDINWVEGLLLRSTSLSTPYKTFTDCFKLFFIPTRHITHTLRP